MSTDPAVFPNSATANISIVNDSESECHQCMHCMLISLSFKRAWSISILFHAHRKSTSFVQAYEAGALMSHYLKRGKINMQLCSILMGPIIYFLSAVVTIGFNSVTYSVVEDAGSVHITVSIMNGTLARNVVVTLSTVSGGTATGKFNERSSCTLVKNSSI